VYGGPLPSSRLAADLADKMQQTTQMYVRRPYGVGLLVAACDSDGPHLYQTCPSGNVYEYHAAAIGARSQAGKTYLEKHYEGFGDCTPDELIMHAVRGLAGCVTGEAELTVDNGSVGIVGPGDKFRTIEGEELRPYLERLEGEGGADAGEAKEAEPAADAMEA
jgi:20S proteasome subunit alpha 6